MLGSLELTNFKVFKQLKDLEFAPITILCGSNSCGKSTILQSILLAKQTFESKNPNMTVLMNGRLIHLGPFEDCIYNKKLENLVELKYKFNFQKENMFNYGGRRIPINIVLHRVLSENAYRIKNANHELEFKICLESNTDKGVRTHLKPIKVKKFGIKIKTTSPEGEEIPGVLITASNIENELYKVNWLNVVSGWINPKHQGISNGEGVARIEFSQLFPRLFNIENDKGSYKEEEKPSMRAIFNAIQHLSILVEQFFSAFRYIGPLREEPLRRYIYEDEIVEIGTKGENAPYIFLTEQDQKISKVHFFVEEEERFVQQNRIQLSSAVEKWLAHMRIKGMKSEPNRELIRLTLFSNLDDKTRVNIADVGFGVSQIFPILLEGLRMPSNNTLILEQPEIHLHPNLQMQMADYFISLALSNKQVLVETHSDHIINRLVRRVVEDESGELNKLIKIYFITSKDSNVSIEQIELDHNKGIINWPKDFFDQTATEQEKIIQAGLKKRRLNRKVKKEENGL